MLYCTVKIKIECPPLTVIGLYRIDVLDCVLLLPSISYLMARYLHTHLLMTYVHVQKMQCGFTADCHQPLLYHLQMLVSQRQNECYSTVSRELLFFSFLKIWKHNKFVLVLAKRYSGDRMHSIVPMAQLNEITPFMADVFRSVLLNLLGHTSNRTESPHLLR
jgi:hypothetical protein